MIRKSRRSDTSVIMPAACSADHRKSQAQADFWNPGASIEEPAEGGESAAGADRGS
jgi:hypothetical protein